MNHNATALVSQFIEDLNNKDFSGARTTLHNDFVFEGVLGRREGADL